MNIRCLSVRWFAALCIALLGAQCLLAGAAAAPAAVAGARPKVILDEDEMGPGGTNIQATLMLAQDKAINLLGITVPTGDGWQPEEIEHVLRALQIAHRAIAVYPGAMFPLLNTRRRERVWQKLYGELFYDGAYMSHWPSEGTDDWTALHPQRPYWVPALPEGEPTTHAHRKRAVRFMIQMVHKYPHQVTIIAAGPLTDLALAAKLDPRFASLAKALVFMGGSFNPQPANTPFARAADYVNSPRVEFNMRFDPEAASIVLHQPWHEITEVPLDATSPTLMTRQLLQQIAHGGAPFDHYLGRFGQVYPLWDETAVAVWLDPALITAATMMRVDVDTSFTANYGATLSWPVGHGPNLGERPVRVVTAVDVPRLNQLVVRLLTAPKPIAIWRSRHMHIRRPRSTRHRHH